MSRRDRQLPPLARVNNVMCLRVPGSLVLGVALVALVHDARADDAAQNASTDPSAVAPNASVLAEEQSTPEKATAPSSASGSAGELGESDDVAPMTPSVPANAPVIESPLALPTGADRSGVTSKSISVPTGAGTITGMSESFSAQLSTGIATFTVPFALPAARGAAQPALSLSYSSSGGFEVAGVGWSVGVPFIARQTDRGVPRYTDQSIWNPLQDRFVFNGGQELVPICTVGSGGECAGKLDGEVMPAWASGWQYFRPRVEGSFLRFFWSSNHLTWRVQDKSGVTMELGAPLDGSGYLDALERNPDVPAEIYRWHLVRQYDTHGLANPAAGWPNPANVVVYRYQQDQGMAYLSDIYDTPPAGELSPGTSAGLSSYAHHTRLLYELRSDPTHSYRSGFRIDQRLRLVRVDVTSKAFGDTPSAARRLVRRYHLDYDPTAHVSLLASVQVEGRCTASEDQAEAELGTGAVPDTSCPRLPAMKFAYSHVTAKNASGGPGLVDLTGYEGFDETLHTLANSPNHSVDEELTDLFDVNADGLPDVLVTAAGVYGSGHGVFFNGPSGNVDTFGAATPVCVNGVIGADAGTLSLKNPNVAPLDLDGDGIVDLLHMPKVKTYAVYSPVYSAASGWCWAGRNVTAANNQSPKIDLGQDALDTQVMDVNFDGLVDVVVTTGTEIQTYFALGRNPGGDGQFGHAIPTGAKTASLYTDPVTACLPWSATPVRFSDPDVKVSDMNGDGIADIVRVRKGDIRYWPGRGNGFWGTGKRDNCGSGSFAVERHVTMASSPQYSDIQGDSLRLDDVNGDGLTDLVQVRFGEVDVWLNVDGVSFTDRHIIKNTPANPSYANRVRLADINGSGTRDILWGDGGNYRYMDLSGGARPWVLTQVENGLGKTTTLEYSTSTAEMLAADKAGVPWSKRMPTVTHIVKRVTETDNLVIAGKGPASYVTEYAYADPVYEGRQREFRGFSRATARRVGDSNSPTDVTESTFLLGECVDEDASDGTDACSLAERWRDNPREALKGLPVLTEKRDELGHTLSTEHMTYRLRRLYVGLDGREVRHAFESGKDVYLYDTAATAVPSSQTVQLTDVELDDATKGPPPIPAPNPALTVSRNVKLAATAGRAHIRSESVVDGFGNRLQARALGCTEGCPAGLDETITTYTDPIRPAGDPTGWLWRTEKSRVEGSGYFLGPLRKTTIAYNAEGDPLTTTSELVHTLPLDRFHATGLPLAPPPSDAANDGNIVWTNQYDGYGNLTRESGPDSRCRDVGYDPSYASLPVVETIYRNGCNNGPLATAAAYDRGLGLVTIAIDMQNQQTKVVYDGFGRLTALYRPHPTSPGQLSPVASVKVEYFLPPDTGKPFSIIHTETQDGQALDDATYMQSYAFVDGLGRTLVTLSEADPSAGDQGQWIAQNRLTFDAKGAVDKKYLEAFYTGPPTSFPLATPPSVPFGEQSYDAFGRSAVTKDLDGTVTLLSAYHALSVDHYDAADLTASAPTPASETRDGHGRVAFTVERYRDSGTAGGSGGALRERETRTTYTPTGEPLTITRQLLGTTEKVMRWMRYDSLGRMVLNVEPNTSQGFTDAFTIAPLPGTLKAWRYAYNQAGDLVGTSDARGCGVNFAYDGAGRLKSEDYSPCTADHALYSAPNITSGTGIEVAYYYDTVPSDAPAGMTFTTPFLLGRLVATADRASLTVNNFDGRGRVTESAVRLAKPGTPSDTLANRYAPRWYRTRTLFDSADREIATTTGATVTQTQGTLEPLTGSTSAVTTSYTARGTVKTIGGSYGPLVTQVDRDADGQLLEIKYGDAAQTTTGFEYDIRRRLKAVQTYRGPPAAWTSPPSNYLPAPAPSGAPTTFQLLLQDEGYSYDVVGNPVEIHDWRIPSEWPSGAKPVTKKAKYDDLYRLKRVDYEYSAGDDDWTSPFDAENSGEMDPRRAKPSPHVAFPKRLLWQTYGYDWKGNTSQSDDDAHGFYDRSLGAITNDAAKPYQLTSADNTSLGGGKTGKLATHYDASGNLTRLELQRDATACLPSSAQCSQVFIYHWDEVGRLSDARRWDVTPSELTDDEATLGVADVQLRYAYDAGDQRVLKTAFDAATNAERHTAYIFESLELRRAAWVAGGGPSDDLDYEQSQWTEVPYLYAHGVRLARVAWDEPDVPTVGAAQTHVLLELGDHVGSTSVVLDLATSELVERSAYQAYGGAESDYRPGRWKGFREDYGFSGKESDVEVGLEYFGKRYYAPLLGRWVSPDPLTIHGLGADPNLYAYVSGKALMAVDPFGLEGKGFTQAVFEGLGFSSSTAKFATKVAHVLNPATAAADRLSVGSQESATAIKKGDYVGAAVSAESAVRDVTGVGTGMVVSKIEEAVNDGVQVAKASAAATQLVLGKGSAVKHLDTLGDFALHQSTKAVVAATAGLQAGVNPRVSAKPTMAQLDSLLERSTKGLGGPSVLEGKATIGCFVAGTLVRTLHGDKPIELIAEGDWVLSSSERATGELSWRPVTQLLPRPPSKVLSLVLRDAQGAKDVLGVTPNHPFWVEQRGWTQAGWLVPGDQVWSLERGWLRVVAVQLRPRLQRVYNFEVDEDHTYVVGTLAAWVHNECPPKSIVELGERGRVSEARVLGDMGLPKNTTGVTTAEGTAIPDSLTESLSVEVKDRTRVSATRQIRIQTDAARASGRQSVLVTGEKTKVSGPALRAFDQVVRRSDLGPKK